MVSVGWVCRLAQKTEVPLVEFAASDPMIHGHVGFDPLFRSANRMITGPGFSKKHERGMAMIAALMLVMASCVIFTVWIELRLSRARQVEALDDSVQRGLTWGNNRALNFQNTYVNSFGDNITSPQQTSLFGPNWGGVQFNACPSMSAFRSINRTDDGTIRYLYNNIQSEATSDGTVFFTRVDAGTGDEQSEHVSLYNYLKTYPTALLGDLFHVHTRPTGATGTVTLASCFRVDGRVIVWEGDAETEHIRAESCLSLNPKAVRTTMSTNASGRVMPQNYPATARCTAGTSGVVGSAANTDGSLNMISNAAFPPGSLEAIAGANGSLVTYNGPVVGLLGLVTGLLGGVVGGLVDLGDLSSSLTDPVQIQRTYLSSLLLSNIEGADLGSVIPLYSGYTGLLNIGIVAANHPNLTHVKMTGTIDLVIVLGQLTPLGLAQTAGLSPVVIWVDQASKPRHVIFIGESRRPIVFATGKGYGQNTYVAYVGVTALLGGPLEWRLHWVNEYTHLWIVPPIFFGSLVMTGSMRTNWSIDSTDAQTVDRIVIQRDGDQSALEKFLPRDAWLEPYSLIR